MNSSQFRDLSSKADGSRPGKWLPFQSTRVSQGRYDSGLAQVHVIFRNGVPWTYENVPRNVWRNFRRSTSPGKFINRVLNSYPYHRGEFEMANENEMET